MTLIVRSRRSHFFGYEPLIQMITTPNLYADTVKCYNVCKRHRCQANWTYHFSSCYFNGIKIVNVVKCIFEEIMPKLSVNFGNISHKTLTRINILVPSVIWVLLHHDTVTNVDQICRWSAISFSLIAHTEVTVSPAWSSNSCCGWFVWNQLHVLVWRHNKMMPSLYQHMAYYD